MNEEQKKESNKKIEFDAITYPEITLQNFCTCGEKHCEEDSVGVAIEIIIEIPKKKLGDFVNMLLRADQFSGTDFPIHVTIEPKNKDHCNNSVIS